MSPFQQETGDVVMSSMGKTEVLHQPSPVRALAVLLKLQKAK